MLHRILEAAGEGIRDLHSSRLKSVLCNLEFSEFREKEKNSGVCVPDVSDGQRDRTFQFGASCARERTEPVSLTAREGAVSAAGGEIESFVGTAPRRFSEQKLGRKPRLLSSRSLASGEPKSDSRLT